jgi:hypothetical protein
MAESEEFESKFQEIISKEDFDEPDLQKIAIHEISETLSSVSFLCAQLSHLMNEVVTSMEVEVTPAFMELLTKVKETSDKFNDEIQVDIVFNDDFDEDEEDDEEEEEFDEED